MSSRPLASSPGTRAAFRHRSPRKALLIGFALALILGGGEAQLLNKVVELSGVGEGEAIPIVLPDETHTRLEIQEKGLEAIENIEGDVATVVVIGPFRSGKSFVLNQLMGLPCDKGFAVGHRRHAQTKGIWYWSQAKLLEDGSRGNIHVLFVDTEGFEAAGKADVYDDRVFALSALLSSVLIYNIPETVKEADIEKLQFALELAEEFDHRAAQSDTGGNTNAHSRSRVAFKIPSLLWLIQRDFLQGRSVQQMVEDALKPVANPNNNRNINHLNYIRNHLQSATRHYRSLGMVQPHLNRTALCELKDKDFNPKYVSQRNDLREMVGRMLIDASSATDDVRQHRKHTLMTGPVFAKHLRKLVTALNSGEIPSVKSVTHSFNEEIINRLTREYENKTKVLGLPMEEQALRGAHQVIQANQIKKYQAEKFGRDSNTDELRDNIKKIFSWVVDRNTLASKSACEASYFKCTDIIDMLQLMHLPSKLRFDTVFSTQCNNTFQSKCVGPSYNSYSPLIAKQFAKERRRFVEAYNQKLLNGVTLASLMGVIVFRFVWPSPLLELFAWAAFLFLEVWLKTHSLIFTETDHPYWKTFVGMWEVVVFNEYYDLNSFIHVLIPLVALLAAFKSGQRCWSTAKSYTCVRVITGLLKCLGLAVIVFPVKQTVKVFKRLCCRSGEDSDESCCPNCCNFRSRRGLPFSYKEN